MGKVAPKSVPADDEDFDPIADNKATAKLRQAERFARASQPRNATRVYQEIVARFPDTPSALIASDRLVGAESKRANDAMKILIRAESLRHLGSIELAKLDYETILKLYPGTPHARIARKVLASLK
jgi:TolA-binding protein